MATMVRAILAGLVLILISEAFMALVLAGLYLMVRPLIEAAEARKLARHQDMHHEMIRRLYQATDPSWPADAVPGQPATEWGESGGERPGPAAEPPPFHALPLPLAPEPGSHLDLPTLT